MKEVFEKSEFVVSEQTAQWVRALKQLNKLWGDVLEIEGCPEPEQDCFYKPFREIEDIMASRLGEQVLENLGWTDLPQNMI